MKTSLFVAASLTVTLIACDQENMEPTGATGRPPPNTDVQVAVAGFTTLSTNLEHTCILDSSGRAFCAGYGGRGAIGYGGQGGFIVEPYPVTGGHNFASVTAGSLHTCALTTSGQAYCWGSNAKGELGAITPKQCEYGSTPCAFAPVPVIGGLTFAQIDAGNQFTCALDAAGRAYCWGDNTFGQLGDGTTASRTSPALVGGGLTFAALGTGGFHTCGLAATGDLFCWGDNSLGQLGAPSSNQCTYFQTYPCSTSPIRVAGLRFMAVDPGTLHTCALEQSGKGYCWGRNSHGQLGDGGLSNQPRPTPVASPIVFTRIASGTESSCAIDASDNGYCWGQSFGRAPALIGGGFKWRVLLPHDDHRCGLAPDGSPFCWGLEQYGELGNGGHHQEQFLTPQLLAPPHVIDQPPVAKLVVTGCVNLACTFNGTFSTDDFAVVRWSWDFGDGTTSGGGIANHTFPQNGTYTVTLTVFDGLQQNSSASTSVQVYSQPSSNQPPVASLTVVCVVRPDGVGADCRADGRASSDPDGIVASYSWTATGRSTLAGPVVSYPYRVGTSQTVTLTVTDNLGATNTKSITFVVGSTPPPPPPPPSNQPPVAAFTYQCVVRADGIGSDCKFNGSSSSDLDGNVVSFLWQATNRPNQTGVNASFPYKRGSSPTITLTVTDNQGATGSKSLTFSVP